jgi:hypothetical protein
LSLRGIDCHILIDVFARREIEADDPYRDEDAHRCREPPSDRV